MKLSLIPILFALTFLLVPPMNSYAVNPTLVFEPQVELDDFGQYTYILDVESSENIMHFIFTDGDGHAQAQFPTERLYYQRSIAGSDETQILISNATDGETVSKGTGTVVSPHSQIMRKNTQSWTENDYLSVSQGEKINSLTIRYDSDHPNFQQTALGLMAIYDQDNNFIQSSSVENLPVDSGIYTVVYTFTPAITIGAGVTGITFTANHSEQTVALARDNIGTNVVFDAQGYPSFEDPLPTGTLETFIHNGTDTQFEVNYSIEEVGTSENKISHSKVIAWDNFVLITYEIDDGGAFLDLRARQSTDYGVSFGAEYVIFDNNYTTNSLSIDKEFDGEGSIIRESDGDLFMFWYDDTESTEKVQLMYSSDNGLNWIDRGAVGGFESITNGHELSYLSEEGVHIVGNTIHLSLEGTNTDNPSLGDRRGVYYNRSDDDGVTWLYEDPDEIQQLDITTDANSFGSYIAVNGDNLLITWIGYQELGIQYAFSTDGGDTWDTENEVTTTCTQGGTPEIDWLLRSTNDFAMHICGVNTNQYIITNDLGATWGTPTDLPDWLPFDTFNGFGSHSDDNGNIAFSLYNSPFTRVMYAQNPTSFSDFDFYDFPTDLSTNLNKVPLVQFTTDGLYYASVENHDASFFIFAPIPTDEVAPVVSLIGSTPVEVEETGTLSDGVWSWREHNASGAGGMDGVAEIEVASPNRAKIVSTESNTYGSMYFFKTYPREVIEDKDVKVKYQITTSGTSVPKLRFQIVDGAFDRTSLTDFPSGSARIVKGNGILASNEISSLSGSPTHTLTASGGTEDFVTIFVRQDDSHQTDHNANGFIEFIEIVGLEKTTFDSNTTLSAVSGSGSNEYGTFTATPLSVGYTELGATCLDDVDGQIDGNVVIGGDVVDSSTPATYTVDYDCQDIALNDATTVQRVVNVITVTAPVVTLVGETPDIEVISGTYTELGATCFDNEDGQINGSVAISGAVNINTVGIYDIDYDCQDSGGLDADTEVRMVAVVDTTIPLLALNGDSVVFLEAGLSNYIELSAMCFDLLDGQIDGNVVISGDTVDENTIGTYVIDYDCDDANSNSATSIQRTVNVSDTIAPEFFTILTEPITVVQGTNTTEFDSILCIDSFEGDITNSVILGGQGLDIDTRGTQFVEFVCFDNSSNQSERTVEYIVKKKSTSFSSLFDDINPLSFGESEPVPQLEDIPPLVQSPQAQVASDEPRLFESIFANLFDNRLGVDGEKVDNAVDVGQQAVDVGQQVVETGQQAISTGQQAVESIRNSPVTGMIQDIFDRIFSFFG